jgi:hypothetical protein
MTPTVATGALVPWADVPSGALVKVGMRFYVRLGDRGWCVGFFGERWQAFGGRLPMRDGPYARARPQDAGWPWGVGRRSEACALILAGGLSGHEAGSELRAVALISYNELRTAREGLVRLLEARIQQPRIVNDGRPFFLRTFVEVHLRTEHRDRLLADLATPQWYLALAALYLETGRYMPAEAKRGKVGVYFAYCDASGLQQPKCDATHIGWTLDPWPQRIDRAKWLTQSQE